MAPRSLVAGEGPVPDDGDDALLRGDRAVLADDHAAVAGHVFGVIANELLRRDENVADAAAGSLRHRCAKPSRGNRVLSRDNECPVAVVFAPAFEQALRRSCRGVLEVEVTKPRLTANVGHAFEER